jgi:hypothetical protein
MAIAVKQIESLPSDEHAASGTVWKETKANIGVYRRTGVLQRHLKVNVK